MKVLILCSGGDAPGMNRFICDLYKAFKNGVYYAYAGFKGLTNDEIFPLKQIYDNKQKNQAGTMIKSSRFPQFKEKKYFNKALKNVKGFDAVVILGGNGSERGAKELYENGVNTIFVPATIDNDVDDSSYSIGFSTAVKECVYTIKNSMPSISAFNNSCLFEVMGRDCDAICNEVAKRVKADYVVNNLSTLDYKKMKEIVKKKSATIVVRENIAPIEKIAEELNSQLKNSAVKTQIVGRTQRGGVPTKEELFMVSAFAKEAIKCLKTKIFGVRILADKNKKIVVKEFK